MSSYLHYKKRSVSHAILIHITNNILLFLKNIVQNIKNIFVLQCNTTLFYKKTFCVTKYMWKYKILF